MLLTFFLGGLVGLIFGFAFEKSKVFNADSIIGQMLFKRFIMLKVFLTAVLTSMIILNVMQYFGWVSLCLESLSVYQHIVGGSLLGIGIGLSGACPGTVFAQMGVGYKDSFFTALGCFFAAGLYYFYGAHMVVALNTWEMGRVQISSLAFKVGFGVFIVLFLWVLEKNYKWKKEVK